MHVPHNFTIMHNSKKAVLIIALLGVIIISSCKNYYNDTIDWIDSIKIGTELNTVKSMQPDFVTVYWNRPEINKNIAICQVNKIKGNNDPLNMIHFLVFENNRFLRRETRK